MKSRLILVMCVSVFLGCDEDRASPDASVGDAGPDATSDATVQPDGGPDGGTDASPDAFVPDAPPPRPTYDVTDFEEVVSRAIDVLVCDAQAALECGYAAGCNCSGATPVDDPEACIATALESCRAVQRDFFEGALADAVLSSELADECLARQRALRDSCETANVSAIDVCTRVTSAANALGTTCTPGPYPQLCGSGEGACLVSSACIALGVEGWDCEVAGCATGLVCRGTTCAPPGAAGDSCEDLDDCESPLVCVAGECGERADVGSTCTEDDLCVFGARCEEGVCVAGVRTCGEEGDVCGSGHVCNTRFVGACEARGAAGTSCDANGDCIDGLLCFGGTCSDIVRGDGEGCFDPTAGQLPCGPGLYCNIDETLTCQARFANGAACTRSSMCPDGSTCVAGVCGPSPVAGEMCGIEYDCAPGVLCDATVTCSPPSTVGGECSVAICAPGLVCRGSLLCEEPVGDGAECFSDIDCIPTHRCNGFPGVCVPRPADGEPCSFEECGPSSFCKLEPVVECTARFDRCG